MSDLQYVTVDETHPEAGLTFSGRNWRATLTGYFTMDGVLHAYGLVKGVGSPKYRYWSTVAGTKMILPDVRMQLDVAFAYRDMPVFDWMAYRQHWS